MQLSINRYFKHKTSNEIIRSVMKKGEMISSGGISLQPYHLYVYSVAKFKENVHDAVLVSTGEKQDNWHEELNAWTFKRGYEDYNPFLMTHNEANTFLQSCHKDKDHGLRLGQAIINRLDDKTPTPNIEIFNSLDETFVLEWFYKSCVLPA
jgi:hypothetical protein